MVISIITINYNNAVGLQKTFNSVFSQTFPDIEYIVVDGGSTDESLNIIQQNQNKITYWISEKDNGIYHAMNKGILKATGKYLVFLNSGDFFANADTLNNCYSFMKKVSGMDIYYGDLLTNNHKKLPDKSLYKHPSKINFEFFKYGNINHQASIIRTCLFKEFGLYPEQYKIAADYWLWLKSLLNNKKFKYLNFPMVVYDFSGISGAEDFNLYGLEMNLIWQTLIPESVQEIVAENEQLKRITEYKIVKAAIKLNNKYQRLRNRE